MEKIDPSVDALKHLCQKVGGHKMLALEIGVNDQTIYQIVSGVKLPSGNPKGVGPTLRRKIEAHYPNWLASGKGETAPLTAGLGLAPTSIALENNPDYPAVRRVQFKLSAGATGFGVEYREEDGAPIVFQRQWYEGRGLRPDKLFAIKVANHSMEPGLFDGDTVVVNTDSVTPKDGVVFAVNYEGEMVIKRLARDGGQWWLCSDNPDQRRYPRKVCDEHSIIIGEIVHKQSERI
ncbi:MULTISPECIES: S24 family peptidase [Giesbergeria]|uniref:Helix-turn-helix transcriptional regulator n=1 Tax=Giesbergeria sinuosa TaxID=80883 RepID=A0ABV9QCL5_9BURK